MRIHITYTGGTIGMVESPNGLVPGADMRGWLRRVNAQREWLRANAEPTTPRVLLVPLGGGEPQPWDGKQTVYGGVTLNSALIEQLQLVYPRSGGPWTYQTLKLWRRQNGDLVLERAASTPK